MKFGRRIAFELNDTQSSYMWRAAGVCRFTWNWALARWNEDAEKAKAETNPEKQKELWPSVSKLKSEWSATRREQFPWSLEVTKCAGTQAIFDLGGAFSRAHKEIRDAKQQRRKPRKMFGFPKFKSRNKVVPNFALWNDQFSICHHHCVFSKSYSTVCIPNLGPVRLRELVPSIGGILGARISYRRGRWFIAFQFDTEWNNGEQSDKAKTIAKAKDRKAGKEFDLTSDRVERLQPLHPKAGTVGGGDVGLIDNLVTYITNANGEILIGKEPNPRRLTRTEKHKRLRRRRERKLSRSIHRARMLAAATIKTAKGDFTPVSGEDLRTVRHRLSKRQQRQSAVLSKELWQRSDQRDDFLHKISNKIALSAEIIVLEDLHVAGLLANRNLASSLSDAALGRLMTMIDYKAERAGGIALRAPRLFPSTKRCFDCGEVRSGLKMSDREWTCSACGVAHDRDINAAKNLHWLGHLAMS